MVTRHIERLEDRCFLSSAPPVPEVITPGHPKGSFTAGELVTLEVKSPDTTDNQSDVHLIVRQFAAGGPLLPDHVVDTTAPLIGNRAVFHLGSFTKAATYQVDVAVSGLPADISARTYDFQVRPFPHAKLSFCTPIT